MRIIYQRTLHYTTAFELHPLSKDGEINILDIISVVRLWLLARYDISNHPHNHRLYSRYFVTGISWFDNHTNTDVRTASYISSISDSNGEEVIGNQDAIRDQAPTHWTLNYRHRNHSPDGKQSGHHHWDIDLSIRKLSCGIYRIAIRTYFFYYNPIDGVKSEPPRPSIPKIVRDILSSNKWEIRSAGHILTQNPIEIDSSAYVDTFIKTLIDPKRVLPVVLYNNSAYHWGSADIDSRKLARGLAGSATVFHGGDSRLTTLVNDQISNFLKTQNSTIDSRHLRCEAGMIRIYRPLVGKALHNSRLHRYYRPSNFAERTQQELFNDILRNVQVGASPLLDEDIFTANDINALQIADRLNHLRKTGAVNQEYVNLLWEENAQVIARNKELQERLENVTTERDHYFMEYSEIAEKFDQEVSTAKYRAESTLDALTETKQANTELHTRLEAMENLAELPLTTLQILDKVTNLHADKFIVHDNARKSAGTFTSRQPERIWRLLWQMATILHPLVFKEKVNDIEGIFNARSEFEYAKSEGRQTKQSSEIVSQRHVLYNGERHEFWAHIKLQAKLDDGFRVYFFYDNSTQKIVVCHCGAHLENFATKRNKI